MFSITGTEIFLTRGDTGKATINLTYSDGTAFVPSEGDSVRFAMAKDYTGENVLVDIDIPTDSFLLHIEPEDTAELDYGKYYYDIQVTLADGDVDTVISGRLTLGKEVM